MCSALLQDRSAIVVERVYHQMLLSYPPLCQGGNRRLRSQHQSGRPLWECWNVGPVRSNERVSGLTSRRKNLRATTGERGFLAFSRRAARGKKDHPGGSRNS